MRRIDLDLASKPGDPEVNGAVERFHLAMRGGLQKPVALQRPVWIFRKQLEQIELACREGFLVAIDAVWKHQVISAFSADYGSQLRD